MVEVLEVQHCLHRWYCLSTTSDTASTVLALFLFCFCFSDNLVSLFSFFVFILFFLFWLVGLIFVVVGFLVVFFDFLWFLGGG